MGNSSRYASLLVLLGLLIVGRTQVANASLVTNGTFDTDLSGWTIDAGTTTGVTWIAGTARVGQPGTPGTAIFEQSFDIAAGTNKLAIRFDYEWQINRPTNIDTFLAELIYESTTGTVTEMLVNEGSDTGIFSPPAITYSDILTLSNLDIAPNNGTIRFTLVEQNPPKKGTRIELDNVRIDAVPEASALVIWTLLAGVGLVVARRRHTA